MKHPYICAFLTVALSFTAYQPGFRLNAAELWNSTDQSSPAPSYYSGKKGGNGSSGVYYNAPKNSRASNSGTLFNVQDEAAMAGKDIRGGLQANIETYKNINKDMRPQKSSKQFAFMSPAAVADRQTDIDNALQIEYEQRKATAKLMMEVYEEVQQSLADAEKADQEQRAADAEEKRQKDLEREQKKTRALSGKKGSYKSSGSRGTTYTAGGTTSSSTGLKKPTRLFNDPND